MIRSSSWISYRTRQSPVLARHVPGAATNRVACAGRGVSARRSSSFPIRLRTAGSNPANAFRASSRKVICTPQALEARFGLDLLPRDDRLARLDAGTGLTSSSSVGEVLQHLGKRVRGQVPQLGSEGRWDDCGEAHPVLGEIDDLASGGLMRGGSDIAGRIVERKLAHNLVPDHP